MNLKDIQWRWRPQWGYRRRSPSRWTRGKARTSCPWPRPATRDWRQSGHSNLRKMSPPIKSKIFLCYNWKNLLFWLLTNPINSTNQSSDWDKRFPEFELTHVEAIVIEEVPVAGQRRQEEEDEVDGEGEGDAQQRPLRNCLRRFSKVARQIGSSHDSSYL